LASFTLTIDSSVTRPVLGENITLNVTLERTGNGTEYPGAIIFELQSFRNITWAYKYVHSVKEYEMLFRGEDDDDEDDMIFSDPSPDTEPIDYLTTPSLEDLERDRKRDEERTSQDGCLRMCARTRRMSRYGGGESGAMREFWDDEPQEKLQFTLELPL
jgi:hypothetical protein